MEEHKRVLESSHAPNEAITVLKLALIYHKDTEIKGEKSVGQRWRNHCHRVIVKHLCSTL